jgi:hypothetical protein
MLNDLFEWDPNKNLANIKKHGVSFEEAREAFKDTDGFIEDDPKHSTEEMRYAYVGKTQNGILTVRYTLRKNKIRIFGAGFWREGRKDYETKNSLH